MNIKIGKVELRDWKREETSFISLTRISSAIQIAQVCGLTYGAVVLYLKDPIDLHWKIKFWYGLQYMNNIHNNSVITGTEEQVKEYTDNFLIRMNKLLAFR